MGRKKKQVVEVPSTQTISYQGAINLSINRGGKTVVKKQYHNSGMPELFRFIANCLGGNISASLRPVKIRLFRYPAAELAEPPLPSAFRWSDLWEENKLEAVTPFITYDATPVIARVTDHANPDKSYYNITFHFNIPFSYITSQFIQVAGFYPNNVTDNKKASAYYLFTRKDDDNIRDIWDAIQLPDTTGDFSLIIDWTLTVKNA